MEDQGGKIVAAGAQTLGAPVKRGILMEAVTAAVLLLAGANIKLVMRHPEANNGIKSKE